MHLRTFLIASAILLPALTAWWLLGGGVHRLLGLAILLGFSALVYRTLMKSQTRNPRTRGEHNPYSGTGSEL